MRNIITYAIAGLCLVMVFSCKSQPAKSAEGDYCSCTDGSDNDQVICYSAIAESIDVSMSKKKAMSDARAGLASMVQTYVKTMTSNFNTSNKKNTTELLDSKYREATQEVINQTLSDIKIVCDKLSRTQDGKYVTSVRLEVKKANIVKSAEDRGLLKSL